MAATAHLDDHGHNEALHHQFEDIDQQNESYIVGMWTFLVTEVMFFGALFFVYTLYRSMYQMDFFLAHESLDVLQGGFNTVVLLISSWTMAVAVRHAQLHAVSAHDPVKSGRERRAVLINLGITLVCAVIFLVVKFFEYQAKFDHHLYPGPNFGSKVEYLHGATPNHAQIFFGLYFGMSGLHAIHIIAGILVIGALMRLWINRAKSVTLDYVPTELIGLYWHFVDLVWIFLFPLMYLMPRPH
ncbi:cytochrome c oxidase subunit 3 family protein [bacterium]|nr:MAG: cytochrome c oxidase subunit 3 family protein [bacterium]